MSCSFLILFKCLLIILLLLCLHLNKILLLNEKVNSEKVGNLIVREEIEALKEFFEELKDFL